MFNHLFKMSEFFKRLFNFFSQNNELNFMFLHF